MPPIPVPHRRRDRNRTAFASAVASVCTLAALAGCSSGETFAPACPQLGLLRDAADLTRFRPQGRDVIDTVLDGRITAVPASCGPGEHGTVRSRLQVTFDLTRGPAAASRDLVVPYFVAVTDGDRVLDEQDYALSVAFPANTDKVLVSGEPLTLDIPVSAQKSAAAYKIYVGFRLSPTSWRSTEGAAHAEAVHAIAFPGYSNLCDNRTLCPGPSPGAARCLSPTQSSS